MKKFIGLFAISALLLGACNTEQETPIPDTYGEADVEEDGTDDSVAEEVEADTTDEETDSDIFSIGTYTTRVRR